MTVTAESLRAYIQRFHEALDELSERFSEPDQDLVLFHQTIRRPTIRGYISDLFGVAIEYTSTGDSPIEIVQGAERVEHLLFQVPNKISNIWVHSTFNIDNLTDVKIENCILRLALKITDSTQIRFRNCRFECTIPVYIEGNSNVSFLDTLCACQPLDWQRHIEYAEIHGDNSAEYWSLTQAENRAKDEVLAAMYIAKLAKEKAIDNYEDIFRCLENTVLILGSYDTSGMQRIESIKSYIEKLGYNAILIKEVPDMLHRNTAQKVVAIASLARFIVIDDSTPSGHLNEVEICRINHWTTILLRADGRAASSMTMGASIFSNVILEKSYDTDNPEPAINESVKWAENIIEDLEKKLKQAIPWRRS